MKGMRKTLITTTALAGLLSAGSVIAQNNQPAPAQRPGPGYYHPYGMGPGMMGGYGPGMMGGYGPGYGMGPGMMGGYGPGYGPGMMGGYGPGYGPGMMGGYGAGPGGYGYMGALGNLNLNEQQQDKITDIQRKHRQEQLNQVSAMEDARSELTRLYGADTWDAKAIDKVYSRIFDIQRKMIQSDVQARNQIWETLTPEQRDQLRSAGWARPRSR